jgi:hypothetical protein
MPLFRFRVLKPKPTEWIEQEGETDVDAIQAWHMRWPVDYCATLIHYEPGGQQGEREHFLRIEMESGERLISRKCSSGIYRGGGVKRPGWRPKTLADIAKELDVEVSALEGPWEGEELEYR